MNSESIENQDVSEEKKEGEGLGMGFHKRDQSVKLEEEKGVLEFIHVKNDCKIESMRYLI